MEPKNHLIEKDNHLPNLHFGVSSYLIFQGVVFFLAIGSLVLFTRQMFDTNMNIQ